MKTILHIGMPKAGSTALQKTLAQSEQSLARVGYCYPMMDEKLYNHGLLASLSKSYEDGPREYRKLTREAHKARVENFRAGLIEKASTVDVDCLILSTEYLWNFKTAQNLVPLQSLFDDMGVNSLEILAYVRRPSSFFLSACQQRLRASSRFKPQGTSDANAILSLYKSVFSNARFNARLFDRNSLIGGDIVSDFSACFMPSLSEELSKVEIDKSNTTLSAEAMVILQHFRNELYSDQDDIFNKETQTLTKELFRLDIDLGNSRPVLRPEWRDHIDYHDDAPLLLRDNWGVEFPDFDYHRLENRNYAEAPNAGVNVRDCVEIDDERLADMVARLCTKYRNDGHWLEQLGGKIDPPAPQKLIGWITSKFRL